MNAGLGNAGVLRGSVSDQRGRWILWLPVSFGLGIAIYFALPVEPALWTIAISGVLLAAACVLGRGVRGPALIALAALAGGFSLAQIRTLAVASPVLERRIGPVTVTGTIEAASLSKRGGWRVTIAQPRIARLAREATPRRIRISIRAVDPAPEPGRRLSVRAVLQPPPAPVVPGGFDFARRAWFLGLGAVGFAVSRPTVAPARDSPGWRMRVNRLRQSVTRRIVSSLPGAEGAVAAALTTGERGAIPERVLVAMRDAGLAHLLAISGLHFSLVAALLFGGIRAGLAAIPAVALRYPIKKWAAGGAFAGALVYLVISGASIPTQRAFLMLSAVLLAVLLDRAAISMRLVAAAAAVVLAIAPESLLSASFQMSFAAVVALVAAYESARERLAGLRADAGILRRLALYAFGVALTTLVAGLATAPFAAYHFNRLAVFGLVANLLAVPITGLWIMPCAILAFLLMPFGLEGLGLQPMGWGIAVVIAVAETVSSWPSAVRLVPALPMAFLALVTAGGLFLCLWRGRLRMLGLAGIAAALLVGWRERPPDILVGLDPDAFAVRIAGGLAVAPGTRRFTREYWLRNAGEAEAAIWPGRRGAGASALACDRLGCMLQRGATPVALVFDRAALEEDCHRAALLIAAVPVPRRRCRVPDRLIDLWERRRQGALAIWLEPRGPRVLSARDSRGARPWTAQYRRNRQTSRP